MFISLQSLQVLALAKWILALMITIQPIASWSNTYEASANVIAENAIAHPLYENEDGRKTAALLVALGKFEGALRPDAQGDCDKTDEKTGMCVKGSRPHSFCMFQVNESNFVSHGVTKDTMLSDFNVCTKTALQMVHESFRSCRALPLEDRLNAYAAGRGGCMTHVPKGRHRMVYGQYLFKTAPELPSINEVFWADDVVFPEEGIQFAFLQ